VKVIGDERFENAKASVENEKIVGDRIENDFSNDQLIHGRPHRREMDNVILEM
jgi:hypothetical protein